MMHGQKNIKLIHNSKKLLIAPSKSMLLCS